MGGGDDRQRTTVSIVRNENSVEAAVRQAVALAGGLPPVRGKTVVLKPNLVVPGLPGEGSITDCRVTAAVARLALEAGARVIIAEGSAVGYIYPTDQVDTWESMLTSGHRAVAEQLGLEVVDLNRDEYDEVPLADYYGMPTVPVSRTLQHADLIVSIPVLKVHGGTGVTIAAKNLQGTMPWRHKRRTHNVGLELGLSDINAAVRPGFAVVDALLGQDAGRRFSWNLIFAGRDCTAVDSVCCQAMGFDPGRAALLRFNQERGLGVWEPDRIVVQGLQPAEVRHHFTWPMLLAFASTPEVQYITDEPQPCSACSYGAQQGVHYVKSAHGAEVLRGLRIAVGGSAHGRRGVAADILVGDCARDWASAPVVVPGRAPLQGVVAAEICRLRGLDLAPVIALRQRVPNSDWSSIRPIALRE